MAGPAKPRMGAAAVCSKDPKASVSEGCASGPSLRASQALLQTVKEAAAQGEL